MFAMKLAYSTTLILLLYNFLFAQELYSQSIRPDTSAVWLTGSNFWDHGGSNIISYDPNGSYNGGQTTSYKVERLNFTTSNQDNFLINNFALTNNRGVVYLTMDDPFTYDTLYNFNAEIGDSWTLEAEHTTEFTVTAKGVLNINNQDLEFSAVDLNIDVNGNLYEQHDTIVEKLGFLHRYFLPYDIIKSYVDGNEGGATKCYYDSQLGYVPFSHYTCPNLENLDDRTLSLDHIEFEVISSKSSYVELYWRVNTDSEILEFGIERMSNNGLWESKGVVLANEVNPNGESYIFVDESPLKGIGYYRIKIIKAHEPALYSVVKSIKHEPQESIRLFPNPTSLAQGFTVINSSLGEQSLVLINRLGKRILTSTLQPGKNLINIDLLNPGFYFCIIEGGNRADTHKLVISK